MPLYWPKRARSRSLPLTAPSPTLTELSGLVSCATSPSSSARAGLNAASKASEMTVGLKANGGLEHLMISLPISAQIELRRGVGGTRVVGAVNLGMAVQAATGLRVVDAALAARRWTEQRGRLALAHQLGQVPAV